jgi:tetratricopeptide (TPR) repeat protein
MIISFDEAFGWLNVGDRSHLTPAVFLSTFQLEDKLLPPAQRAALLKSLRLTCESSADILETLELKILLARIGYKEKDYTAAKIDLLDAVDRYKPSSHRQAVAQWLLGILLSEMREVNPAHVQFSKARETFIALGQAAVRKGDAKLNIWYLDRLDSMRLELSLMAEEANFWLNFFNKSQMTTALDLLAKDTMKKIRENNYPLAYEIGINMSRISRERSDTEKGETWVAIGLAALQMGNPRKAVEYLKRATSVFTPYGHQQAVTRWMIGIAQWLIPEDYDQAINNWTNAIDAFRGLQTRAEQDNNLSKRDWYTTTLDTMQKALRTKLGAPVGR